MPLLIDALPDLLGALGATCVIAFTSAAWRRLSSRRPRSAHRGAPVTALDGRRMLRRYTLLRAGGPDGDPVTYETTRPAGTIITRQVDGHPRYFELTDVPLGDGTFAAEPLDHL
ncbi:hypothetical protein [Streptomyces lienomycini]|uniref:Uncharacterized protein n=1 Tax=Streptomyces lienomycini TaxID=284035 RepID=A0ABV9X6G3_9ACTN